MNFGQGTEARGIAGASGSFLADSAASGFVGRLSDAGGALGGEHFGGNLAALRAGVGHGQGFGRAHQQSRSLVNQLESLCETVKVIFNDTGCFFLTGPPLNLLSVEFAKCWPVSN